jgi:putative two-component system response regulator
VNCQRVLIADDEPQVGAIVRRVLTRRGYECDVAGDAESALEALACRDYALLLCDVSMPGRSGIHLLEQLRVERPGLAVVMLTGRDEPGLYERALELGSYGYILKPFESSELLIAVHGALHRRRLELEARAHTERLEEAVVARTAELAASHDETIRRLSRALDFRDPTTGVHVERVSAICERIGRHLGVDDETCELLRVASPLHDVGKIAIPDRILLKPGPLTAAERAVVERHPQIGYELLSGSDSALLEYAASISLTHHERFDGTGYPHRLRGDAIPLEGRITTVADVFEALTSDRPYRAALSVDEALGIVRRERGRGFDPDVLDAFVEIAEAVGPAATAPLAAA